MNKANLYLKSISFIKIYCINLLQNYYKRNLFIAYIIYKYLYMNKKKGTYYKIYNNIHNIKKISCII